MPIKPKAFPFIFWTFANTATMWHGAHVAENHEPPTNASSRAQNGNVQNVRETWVNNQSSSDTLSRLWIRETPHGHSTTFTCHHCPTSQIMPLLFTTNLLIVEALVSGLVDWFACSHCRRRRWLCPLLPLFSLSITRVSGR